MNYKTSCSLLVVLLAIVAVLGYVVVNQPVVEDYWKLRNDFLKHEQHRTFGGDFELEDWEQAANQVLMKAKRAEIDDGCKKPSKFLPSQNFFVAAEKIRRSAVFKIIQKMPKGSILHAHDTAIVSMYYVLNNITYRPDLYVCDIDRDPKLQFFDKPDHTCNWTLLGDLREKRNDVDRKIRQKMTMNSENSELAYPDSDAAWEKFMSIFIFITPFLTYRPIYEDHFYQGLLEFYNDNVLYLELRTTLPTLYDLNGTKYENVEVAKIYKKVTDRFLKDYPDFVGVKLIYAPLRNCKKIEFNEYLKIAEELKRQLPDFIAGFDLVGQEDKGKPLVEFAEGLRSIGNDVQLFFHSGETNWYGTSVDENLVDAVLLNTKRIGHGFALLKHPKVMEMVRDKSIAIEVSPISNQVLGLVKDLRNHPAAALFANNYPVVVSNDDPRMWEAKGLSYDFYEAFVGIMSRSADLRALKKLALNSIEYSSMNVVQKKKAKEIWNRRWEKFVVDLKNLRDNTEKI
ncbi:adenosine deaminase 2 [Copidosoma floridanum]|uniref:adenosine deaminase 2 n=1 Tax=Copidosoma floridanum TaxID=29053 RepID=UPI0006C9C0F3|nr:adenosine deaminase 2 [Copidosoma floridanum]